MRGSIHTLMGRVVMASTRGLGLILVSRALGVAAFGEYSLVIASYAISSGLGTLGLDQAHVHAAGRRRIPAAVLLRNTLWSSALLGLAAGLLLLGTSAVLRSRIFDGIPWLALLLTAAVLPGVLFQNMLSGIVIGRSWFRYYGLTESFKWMLHLGLVAAFVSSGHLNVPTALLSLYLPILLFGLVHALALVLSEPLSTWRHLVGPPDLSGLRHVTRFGTRACAINVAQVLHMRLDVYLIKYFFASSAIVGQYALAVSITDVLLYLGRSVGLVLFAQRSAHPTSATRTGVRMARLAAGVVLTGAILLVTCVEPLVSTIFGPDFIACTSAVLCRLPGLLAETAAFVLAGDLLGLARMRSILTANVIAVAVGTVLNCIFVPLGGIVAAACSFSLASWIRLGMIVRAHTNTSGLSVRGYVQPAWTDVAAIRNWKRASKKMTEEISQ